MITSDSIKNIIPAKIAAKKMMNPPIKDGINPHFKSKYVTYDSLIRSIEDSLIENGLDMVTELLNGPNNTVGCRITIFHSSGEFMTSEDFFLPAQSTPQGYGSASSYVLRYSLSAFWSIASEDDDGNIAQGSTKKTVDTRSIDILEIIKNNQKKYGDIISKIELLMKDHNIPVAQFNQWLKEKYNVPDIQNLPQNMLNNILHILIKKYATKKEYLPKN